MRISDWSSDVCSSDLMKKFGPNAQLAAVTHHWGKYFTKEAQDVLNGTWKSDSTWGGIKQGMAAIEGFGPAVPAYVKKLFLDKQAEIVEIGRGACRERVCQYV